LWQPVVNLLRMAQGRPGQGALKETAAVDASCATI
jgi:hypothetical protein